jgi:hypothetical protein
MSNVESAMPTLWPTLHSLSRADKLLVIQQLAADLAQDEMNAFFQHGTACPVWTPFEAYDAGAALLQMLDSERSSP